ncbi:MAG: hypothetical protein C4321_09425 [Chloroflexota bacterium]
MVEFARQRETSTARCRFHEGRTALTRCVMCESPLCEECQRSVDGVHYCVSCLDRHVPAATATAMENIPVVNIAAAARAGFGSRAAAFALDLLLVATLWMALALVFWLFTGTLPTTGATQRTLGAWAWFWILGAAASAAYFIISVGGFGRTYGKEATGLALVILDGTLPTMPVAIGRFFAQLLSALPLGLGYFWALWDEEGRTWHDMLCRTRVVRQDYEGI